MMEEYTPGSEKEESQTGQMKQWLQDNLRIIVSIFIVVVIAGGIYSYSKRTNAPITEETPVATEEISEEGAVQIADNSEQKTEEEAASASKEETKPATPTTKEEVSSVSTSQETTESFVETAAKGDGATKLARRALANYLEKNPDSALTKEHKIYIEDYLRKNVGSSSHVAVGTQIEFSKDLIQKSIEQSKKLNERQLKNLQKYSARVSSL